jgi:hypothetical protein
VDRAGFAVIFHRHIPHKYQWLTVALRIKAVIGQIRAVFRLALLEKDL